MKKIGFIIILLCISYFSKAQELAAKDFYLHLEKAISSIDSITLTITNYGCLGSQSNMKAKIEKTDNLLKISFYRQRGNSWANSLTNLETELILDTTFTVEKSIFKKNLSAEIIEIQSRPVLIEANFTISIAQGNSSKEFTFRRGEGLYYMLRYNKTWALYFAKK